MKATDEMLWEALDIAQLKPVVKSLPGGLGEETSLLYHSVFLSVHHADSGWMDGWMDRLNRCAMNFPSIVPSVYNDVQTIHKYQKFRNWTSKLSQTETATQLQ